MARFATWCSARPPVMNGRALGGAISLVAAACALSWVGCGPADDVRDGGVDGDAGLSADAGSETGSDASSADASVRLDAGDGLPALDEVCTRDDGDLVDPWPVADDAHACAAGANTSAPLFPADLGPLPTDMIALHALCARFDPAPLTFDHLEDPAILADVRSWLASLLARPPVMRALSGVAPEDRLEALAAAWLNGNALEHVLCGEIQQPDRVGGLHLWSEYYLAEREGRADFECTVEGLDDADVAAVRFSWQPPGTPPTTARLAKPLGSFHVGMSPACFIALGYRAVSERIPAATTAAPAFHARLYGQWVDFALGTTGTGAIETLYPLTDDHGR